MSNLVSVAQRLAEIQAITAMATFSADDPDTVLDMRVTDCPTWDSLVGKTITQGTLCQYDGVKYMAVQGQTVSAVYPPNMKGVESLWRPYTDSSDKSWIYNEYVEIGWRRSVTTGTDDEPVTTWYECTAAAGDNLYSPELVPAIWEVQTA